MIIGILAVVMISKLTIQYAQSQFQSGIGVFHQFDPVFSIFRLIGEWVITSSSAHWCVFSVFTTIIIVTMSCVICIKHKSICKPMVFIALSIVLGLWARFISFHNSSSSCLPWILLCCSVLSAFFAALMSGTDMNETHSKPAKRVWICVALVLIAGFLFRVYRLDTLPPGHAQHTAQWGMIGARKALQQKATWIDEEGRRFFLEQVKLLIVNEPHQEGLNIFVDWLLASWFGPSLVVQRTATAMVGLLSLVALYWTAGINFGRKTACLTMFFAAISPWHIMHSRYSNIEHILPLLLVILSMGLLKKYLQTRSLKTAILLLLVLVADFHVYVIAQFIVPIILIVWINSIFQTKDFRKTSLVTLGVVFLLFSIGIAPKTGLYGCKDHISLLNTSIMAHPSYVIQGQNVVVRNIITVFRGLFLNGEGSFWFHKTNGHLIWPISISLVIGLAYAFVNLHKWAYHSLIMWFFIGLIPALPSSDPAPRRILCALPAIYILAALGVDHLLSRLVVWPLIQRRWMIVFLSGALAVLLLCGAWVSFEYNSISREDFLNGKERRFAEIVCSYLPDYTVYSFLDSYTRIQKIWMICGWLGPEEPSPNAVKFLDPENDLDTLIKTRAIQPVSEEKRGVVFILPAYQNGLTTIQDVMKLFSEGDHQYYRFDPYFKNHDKGEQEFISWKVQKHLFNEVLEMWSFSDI